MPDEAIFQKNIDDAVTAALARQLAADRERAANAEKAHAGVPVTVPPPEVLMKLLGQAMNADVARNQAKEAYQDAEHTLHMAETQQQALWAEFQEALNVYLQAR